PRAARWRLGPAHALAVRQVVFFFCSSGLRRALHSFPTRRSSDLCSAGRWRACIKAHLRRARTISGGMREARRRDSTRSTRQDKQDRKSTRLNSSHVKISYAVFCLKKKSVPNGRDHSRLNLYTNYL